MEVSEELRHALRGRAWASREWAGPAYGSWGSGRGHLGYLQFQAAGPRWGQAAGQASPSPPQKQRCWLSAWSHARGWCGLGGPGWGRGAGAGSPGGRGDPVARLGRHTPRTPPAPGALHVTHVAEELIGQTQVVVKCQEGDPLQPYHDDLRGHGRQRRGPGRKRVSHRT